MQNRCIAALVLVVLTSVSVYSQDWRAYETEQIYHIARQQAFEGHYAEAREKFNLIFTRDPNHFDAKLFIGKTYAWSGDYEEARKQFLFILGKQPNHHEATEALIDVELWSKEYAQALKIIDAALIAKPNYPELLFKKATAFHELQRTDEAMLCLNNLLKIEPAHDKALVLRNQIKAQQLKHAASLTYAIEFVDQQKNAAQFVSAEVSRKNSWGQSVLRANYASRFRFNGIQLEGDLYPKISKALYLYLNFGYSGSELFPRTRGAIEIHSELPGRLEISAGSRYMHFHKSAPITMYTGSIGWYVKNYWLSFRPYITPQQTGTSYASVLTARRYFQNSENYIGLNIGMGYAPDLLRIQTSAGLSETHLHALKSQRIGIVWQQSLKSTWILNSSIELSRQELTYDIGNYAGLVGISIRAKKKF